MVLRSSYGTCALGWGLGWDAGSGAGRCRRRGGYRDDDPGVGEAILERRGQERGIDRRGVRQQVALPAGLLIGRQGAIRERPSGTPGDVDLAEVRCEPAAEGPLVRGVIGERRAGLDAEDVAGERLVTAEQDELAPGRQRELHVEFGGNGDPTELGARAGGTDQLREVSE